MKCPECQAELFLGSRHCPACGAPTDVPPTDGIPMSRPEFFRLALPQKFQSFLHTGIFLCYFSVLVSLVSSLWYPVSGMVQALLCLTIALGLQITKTELCAYLGTVLAAGSLVVSLIADGSFVSMIALVACIFACIGSHALSVSYAIYLVSGKTPEIGDEEGRAMVVKFARRRKTRIVTTAVSCILIGTASVGSILFYLKGQADDQDYHPGQLSDDGRYVSEFADIDLTLPDDWKVYSKTALDEEQAGVDGNDSVIFFAASPDGKSAVRLDIVRQSSSVYTEENLLESYVEDGMLRAEADGVEFKAGQFERLALGGEDYLCLTTVTTGSGGSDSGSEEADAEQSEVWRTHLCRQIGSYSVIFLIYADSDAVFSDFQSWFAQ